MPGTAASLSDRRSNRRGLDLDGITGSLKRNDKPDDGQTDDRSARWPGSPT
jgi:hypothetical protein